MPKHAFAGAAVLMLSTAGGAAADIDAQTIWSDWQDVFARFGGTLEARSEDYAGGVLTLTDVTATSTAGGVESRSNYGDVTLTETANGDVEIGLEEVVETETTSTVDDVTQTQTMRLSQEGLSVVVSEDDGVRLYDIDGETLRIELSDGESSDPDLPAPQNFTIGLSGLASEYRSGIDGDPNAFAQEMQAEALTVTAGTASAPDSMTYGATGIEGEVTGNYGAMPEGPVESLADTNITYSGELRHAGATLRLEPETTGDGGPTGIEGRSESGRATFELTGDALSYLLGTTNNAMTLALPNFPVPVEVTMSEASSGVTLPLAETGTEAPFGLDLTLRDLVIDDAVWGLVDPTGQLPRDPATLVADVDGTAEMSVDLFGGPDAFANLAGPPGTLTSLTLNEVLLDAVGAVLRGSGTLDFPTLDPTMPVGTIELALDGGFALIDRLVALGLIPAEQAAFVKGMSGVVADQVGEDQLESTIVFDEDGGILANGLPLR
ncbi:hypothetical protein [uncultured Jannaschia sp.]|uniref:hypothetical protein n=1 Tax=uncultured Jannaschia sp. TaxID=293347 RepID=UPI002602F2B6|nr:hypothetical protein [uncultured Jannaschia sp.]